MHNHRLERHNSLELPASDYQYEHKCRVAMCRKQAKSAGYCSAHYNRLKRYGDPTYSPRPNYAGIDMSLYGVWNSMRSRCFNPNVGSYRDYGAKGITVCSGWRKSYINFIRDMGSRPTSGMTIDRRDNSGNYSCGHCDECITNGWPANVGWASRTEQSHNSTAVRLLTFQGQTKPIAVWSRELGFSKGTISDRLYAGWTVERALSEPMKTQRNTSPRPGDGK